MDPGAALRKIRPLLKPEALVFASSPNISHYSAIRMLLRGTMGSNRSGAYGQDPFALVYPEDLSGVVRIMWVRHVFVHARRSRSV